MLLFFSFAGALGKMSSGLGRVCALLFDRPRHVDIMLGSGLCWTYISPMGVSCVCCRECVFFASTGFSGE